MAATRKEALLAQRASKVVDLAAYRAGRAAQPAGSAGAAPVIPMARTPFREAVWPIFADHPETHA